MAERPPYTPAGKNLTTVKPSFIAAMISLGVTQPGVTAMPFSTHQRTTSSSKPGETINFAPHSTACLHCSSVMTVPAPTNISRQFSATALIESAAAAVRNVISITSTPPASKAFAVATASFASSNTTTGTTAAADRRLISYIIYVTLYRGKNYTCTTSGCSFILRMDICALHRRSYRSHSSCTVLQWRAK